MPLKIRTAQDPVNRYRARYEKTSIAGLSRIERLDVYPPIEQRTPARMF
jgi:hypothetical protein